MLTLDELKTSGIWPANKAFTSKEGISELKALGLEMFYSGKNGDLYLIPDAKKDIALLMRSDRVSVFDIPVSDTIEGKGKVQNSISILGAKYAQSQGLKTANDFDYKIEGLPKEYEERSQIIELCRPFEVQIDSEVVQLELIYRNYLTGSLFKAYKAGEDPYNIQLKSGMNEWDKFEAPIFTPTTKGETDIPLDSAKVTAKIPEIASAMENLFKSFCEFASSKGITVIDTKFEVFLNANGDWVLGDEILTPESSRFIMSSDFEKGSYKSMDKQIIRNYAIGDKWKERWAEEKAANPTQKVLEVTIPNEIKQEVLKGYEYICGLLGK